MAPPAPPNPLAQTALAPMTSDAGPPSQHAPRPPAPSFDFSPHPSPPSAPAAHVTCGRCGALNEVGIRFCVTCGNALATSAAPPGRGTNPAPAIAPSPVVPVTPPVVPAEPRVCARCRGANDPNAQFCRFCGAPVGDGSRVAAFVGPSHTEPVPASPSADRPVDIPAAPVLPSMEVIGNETNQLHGFASPSSSELPRARLVSISKDGGEGSSHPIGDTVDVGRSEGQVLVTDDRYLSPRHARLQRRGSRIILRDLGSTNGLYLRLRPAPQRPGQTGQMVQAGQAPLAPHAPEGAAPTSLSHPLRDQDLFLVGQQVLRFEVVNDADEGLGPAAQHGTLVFGSPAAPRYARLCQRTVEGVTRDVFYIRKAETVLGRESGDVVFTEDPFLSRRHASVRVEKDPRRFLLTDLGSSNGTFVQVRGEIVVENGDQFRVGQQLFRIDIG